VNPRRFREEIKTFVELSRYEIGDGPDGRNNYTRKSEEITSLSPTEIEGLYKKWREDKELIAYQTYQTSTIHLDDGRVLNGGVVSQSPKVFVTDEFKTIPDMPYPQTVADLKPEDKIFSKDEHSLENKRRRSEYYSKAKKEGNTHYFKDNAGRLYWFGSHSKETVVDRAGHQLWPKPQSFVPKVKLQKPCF
jgi:hypothetical protein